MQIERLINEKTGAYKWPVSLLARWRFSLQAGAVERPNLPIPRSTPPLDVGGGRDRQQERGAFPASPRPAPRLNILLIISIQKNCAFASDFLHLISDKFLK